MEAQRVDFFMMTNAKYFESQYLMWLREQLLLLDDSKWPEVQSQQFKDPTIILIVSLIGGQLGIDRFMLGDTGMGIGKLLTCGGLGIWAIIDWFMVMPAAREKNLAQMQRIIYGTSYGAYTTV